MSKTYEIKWSEQQIWNNTAFITADSDKEVEEKFIDRNFDHPIDSEYSHTECIVDHLVHVTELEEAGEAENVSGN